MKTSNQSLISLQNATVRIRDRFILPNTTWEIQNGQNWAILGPNGSGKSSLVKALIGEVPVVRGKIIRPDTYAFPSAIGFVSFELHQQLIAREEQQDEARFFSDQLDTYQTAEQSLLSVCPSLQTVDAKIKRISKLLDIQHHLQKPIRVLSTGEMRKLLIARALMETQRLLILDELFDGLDIESRHRLSESITRLIQNGLQLILVTHRFEEILPSVTHVVGVKNCQVLFQGTKEAILTPANIDRLYGNKKENTPPPSDFQKRTTPQQDKTHAVLVTMKNVRVTYGDILVLNNLNWTIHAGQHWAIVGPNGSGKSTLLRLISGENPQAYANDIYLFGKRKGSGESIWQIKKQIGMVSSELQIHYRKPIKVKDVVLSGFFDSIGLYRKSSPEQQDRAKQWMQFLGIADMSDRQFDWLSYGERRMVLIARAVVKSPTLLILDEPCQGLDMKNRHLILDIIEKIGNHTNTHLLYVTHHADEIPACITHTLTLETKRIKAQKRS